MHSDGNCRRSAVWSHIVDAWKPSLLIRDRMKSNVTRQQFLWLFLAGCLLMAPALFNGTIFLFPDSIGYFHAGEAGLNTMAHMLFPAAESGDMSASASADIASPLSVEAKDGISTSRSVYYGIPFVLLFTLGGEWALALLQTLIALVAMMAAFRRLAIPVSLQPLVLLGTFLAGLGLFTTVAMPDFFAGLAVLALAMLLPHPVAQDAEDANAVAAARGGPKPAEQWLWLALLLVSCLSHKGILAAVAAMLGVYVAWHLLTDRRWRQLAGPLLVVIIAMAAHMTVNIVVEKVAGQKPLQTPFTLARIVGDGTAQLYLEKNCPQAGYRMCAYLDRLPMSENTFLWSVDADKGIMSGLPLDDREAIRAEAGALVLATLSSYPLHQMGASISNLARQFVTVGVTEYAIGPRPSLLKEPEANSALTGLIHRYEASLAGHWNWPFGLASTIMTITYLGSLAALLVTLAQLRDTLWRNYPQMEIIAWLMLGLLTNAAVSGVIGGVFDRYQGRVAWLAPLAVVAALALVRQLRAHRVKPGLSLERQPG